VRALLNVCPRPDLENGGASANEANCWRFKHSPRSRLLNDSMNALSRGLPGRRRRTHQGCDFETRLTGSLHHIQNRASNVSALGQPIMETLHTPARAKVVGIGVGYPRERDMFSTGDRMRSGNSSKRPSSGWPSAVFWPHTVGAFADLRTRVTLSAVSTCRDAVAI